MRRTRLRLAVAGGVLVIIAAACSSGGSDDATGSTTPVAAVAPSAPVDDGPTTSAASLDGDLRLETTSTRASMVSGGDVLVTVSGAHAGADDLTLTINDRDITGSLSEGDGPRRALVEGVSDAGSTLEVAAGDQVAALTLTNHPISGPVFAGPHLEPWVCTTEAHGLGEATDEDCNAPTTIEWSYVDPNGAVVPVDPPNDPLAAADAQRLAATTTIDGEAVPFIIRTETSVIDRGIASVWVLDPSPLHGEVAVGSGTVEGADPIGGYPWNPAWNGRLVYRFGGGCGTQYSQGSALGVGLDTDLLAKGYALATNTLDTFQTACNPTLSAEAALMTREHFIEHYGVPEFTIGDGGSGGAIQQLLIATAYPGLLDALSPSAPFPDAITISGGVTDCGLLLNYYESDAGRALSDAQRTAVEGHLATETCRSWARLFLGGVNPTDGCSLPQEEVYDAATNPDGARCTLQDMNIAVLGTDPETGFARRPLSNVGIQYGLEALNDATLSPDEFLDLNEAIGGYDIDGQIQPEREVIDEATTAVPYESGGVTGQGPSDGATEDPLLDVPIILRNPYTDDFGDIHTRVQPFVIRERLAVDGQDDPNLALWTSSAGGAIEVLVGAIASNDPIVLLDEWLTTLAANDRAHPEDDRPVAERLADARPAEVDNRCALPDGTTVRGGWEIYDDPGPCRDAFPVEGDPRMAAGAPLRNDIIACTLEPVDATAYDVAFTDAQVDRLERIFPDGVCDWTAPGIGQQPPTDTWPRFDD